VAAHYREQWAGYDLNGDGVISMDENLAVDRMQAEAAGGGEWGGSMSGVAAAARGMSTAVSGRRRGGGGE